MEKSQKDRTLSFSDVQNKLDLSPGMLLEALNEGKIRTNLQRQFQEHENNYQYNKFEYAEISEICPPKDDFFTEENIASVTIHEIDLDEALEKYPELDRAGKKPAKIIERDAKLDGVPNHNNSVWLSVEDLTLRWKVNRFDVISRLRSGELHSNIYDPERLVFLPLVNPFDLYPDEKICQVACHLHSHIWPYEDNYPDLKKSATLYYNDLAKSYGKEVIKIDKDNDEIISTDPEWMPAHEVRVVIGMTPINFVDLLNTGYFETDREQERRDFAKTGGWDIENVPFFKTNDLDTLRVHKESFREQSGRFCQLSRPSPLFKYYFKDENLNDDGDISDNKRISELEAKISELEAAQAAQEATDKNGKPRTASATEAAQASRVEEWKGYAVVMAKVAYECGLEDRTQVTRSAYEKLAKRHGELSKQALELLRDALPEGVTKKTGGPASQG